MSVILCLATMAYLEARGEGVEGMLFVMDVAATRAELENKDVCEIVAEPGQFAYEPEFWSDTSQWQEALRMAGALAILDQRPHSGATHFHSGPPPSWTKDAELVGKWGNHTFWRIEE